MRRLIGLTLIFGALGLVQPCASPAIELGFVPASTVYSSGDSVSVDVVVTGLTAAGEIVSAYDFNVDYNPGLLTFTGLTFGTELGANVSSDLFDMTADAYADFHDFVSGTVNLWSNSWLTDADLAAIQGDTVTLATLDFGALGTGDTGTSLGFHFEPWQDIKGLNAQRLELAPVPEPCTMLLLGSGVLGMLGLGRRRARKAS